MKRILILCTGNSCRSQMAHGYLRHFTRKESIAIYSAGIETHGLNPKAVACMLEDGIDIAHHTSNHVEEYQDVSFDYILTVCDHAKTHCPYMASDGKRLHQSFSDPSKVIGTNAEIDLAFRTTRNAIKAYCKAFVLEYLGADEHVLDRGD